MGECPAGRSNGPTAPENSRYEPAGTPTGSRRPRYRLTQCSTVRPKHAVASRSTPTGIRGPGTPLPMTTGDSSRHASSHSPRSIKACSVAQPPS
ncbi:MAG: hypothetical protein PUD40_00880, partial [Bacteroidales bacterium]|nr:hypothetical protein [Bacteroidales bacterium]